MIELLLPGLMELYENDFINDQLQLDKKLDSYDFEAGNPTALRAHIGFSCEEAIKRVLLNTPYKNNREDDIVWGRIYEILKQIVNEKKHK